MSDTLTRDRAGVVDLGQFKHEQRKAAGSAVRVRMQRLYLDQARALADAATAYLAVLEAGAHYCGPIAVAREGRVVRAVNALAGSDTITEWAELCGEEL